MNIKFIQEDDITNYKKCGLFIGMPLCNFKCCIEAGNTICQNSELVKFPTVFIDDDIIISKYKQDFFMSSIIFGGLEPLDSWSELLEFIKKFREASNDDIVIYTGYYENEISDKLEILKQFPNIIIKFGRFIPGYQKHYDDILGVFLASDNQYAKQIS